MEITEPPEFSSESDDEIEDQISATSKSSNEDYHSNASNILPEKSGDIYKPKEFGCPRWSWLYKLDKPGCGKDVGPKKFNNFKALEKHMLGHMKKKHWPYFCKFCMEKKKKKFCQAEIDLLAHWRSKLHNDDIPEEFKFREINLNKEQGKGTKNPKGTWDVFRQSKVLQDCLNPNIIKRVEIRKELESLFGQNESDDEFEEELYKNNRTSEDITSNCSFMPKNSGLSMANYKGKS